MPIVHVHLLEGRSADVKASLVRELTVAIERSLLVSPEQVQVLISEFGPGHWSRAGVPLEIRREQAS